MSASTTRLPNASLIQLSSRSCGSRSYERSDDDNVSEGTFSSSLTSLETSDSDMSGTHGQNQDCRRHYSPVISCKSLFSDNLGTFDPSDEPCRSLAEYIHVLCGDAEPYTSEWHESTTWGLEKCSMDTFDMDCIDCDLYRSTQRVSFPLSNMRTECMTDDMDDMDRPLSPMSDLEPLHRLFHRLAQYAYAELLEIQPDTTSSNSSWSSESFAPDINSQSETTSDSLATPGHPLRSWDAIDGIRIATSGLHKKSPIFGIPFLLAHSKIPAIQARHSLSQSGNLVDEQFLVNDIWAI